MTHDRHRHGLPTLVALVVAGMIGSGVFTTSGYALESLGSPAARDAESTRRNNRPP